MDGLIERETERQREKVNRGGSQFSSTFLFIQFMLLFLTIDVPGDILLLIGGSDTGIRACFLEKVRSSCFRYRILYGLSSLMIYIRCSLPSSRKHVGGPYAREREGERETDRDTEILILLMLCSNCALPFVGRPGRQLQYGCTRRRGERFPHALRKTER